MVPQALTIRVPAGLYMCIVHPPHDLFSARYLSISIAPRQILENHMVCGLYLWSMIHLIARRRAQRQKMWNCGWSDSRPQAFCGGRPIHLPDTLLIDYICDWRRIWGMILPIRAVLTNWVDHSVSAGAEICQWFGKTRESSPHVI